MSMKVGAVQFTPRFGEPLENLERIRKLLTGVEADLVVLPELPFTGYSFRDREELLRLSDDPANSMLVDELASICRSAGLRIVTGFAERAGDICFNSALLVGPEGLEGKYRKLHLFNREKELFAPGDLPMEVFDVEGIGLGMMVCFDWIFPEVARTLSLGGADILCHPANLVLPYCQRTMLSRCTENLVFAVTANRTGTEDRGNGALTFTGMSQIVAPGGTVLAQAGESTEEVLLAEFDPALSRNKWVTPGNHIFDDLRPEFYRGRS